MPASAPLSSLFEVAFRSRLSKSFYSTKTHFIPFSCFPFDFFHAIQVIFSAFTTVSYCAPVLPKRRTQTMLTMLTTITMVNTLTTLRSGVNNKLTLDPKLTLNNSRKYQLRGISRCVRVDVRGVDISRFKMGGSCFRCHGVHPRTPLAPLSSQLSCLVSRHLLGTSRRRVVGRYGRTRDRKNTFRRTKFPHVGARDLLS